MAIPFQDQLNSTTDLLRPDEKCNCNHTSETSEKNNHRLLRVLTYISLFVGSVASSLLSRFYFQHGGSNRWLATLVQSVGFPLLLIPICLSPSSGTQPFSNFSLRLFVLSLCLGLMLGINNLLIACGASYLPVSTSSLLLSTQLAFTLVFTAVLVRTPLSFTNLNTVILLTIGSMLLAFQKSSNGDRLPGESQAQYYLGFLATLGAAVLFAFYLPIMEIVYRGITGFRMVVEVQIVMEAVATALATTGMTMASDNFKDQNWDLGPTTYWLVLGATVLSWQLCFMGTAGMIFLTTSLHSGICMTALLPINVMAGVVIFSDELGPEKFIAMILCVWGFSSYVYGESKRNVVVAIGGADESNAVTVLVGSVERKYGGGGGAENV